MRENQKNQLKTTNWERIKEYYIAWWKCGVLDKVPLWVSSPHDDPRSREILSGKKMWIKKEDRFNKERTIDCAEEILRATFFGGVAFPCYWPNFGTDVFSAYMGADSEFSSAFPPVCISMIEGEITPVSWAKWYSPILKDYSDLSVIQIKEDNIYWQKTKEFISYALERSQGNYLVGLTDIHPSTDSLSVLRGSPQQLCFDVIDNPEGVKEAAKFLWKVLRKVYEESYKILLKGQEGTCAWINLWAPGKTYPVQNDLSMMLSSLMYKEFFFESLLEEINYLDYSIYHLDVPDALKHLDIILEISRLNAIQWVPGAAENKEGALKWIPVYRKIQAKGKAIIVYCQPHEIDSVLENLAPEGLMISVSCSSEKEAKELLSNLF